MASSSTSKLVFNGATHQVSLVDSHGSIVGTWPAYNNVDSHATLTHLQDRTYTVEDRVTPHRHAADANGPYGSHGIVRFNVPGHPGIGLHSGRANARHLPGPAHPTMGCIRTTDAAMAAIASYIRTAPLTTIEVTHNSAGRAQHATRQNRAGQPHA